MSLITITNEREVNEVAGCLDWSNDAESMMGCLSEGACSAQGHPPHVCAGGLVIVLACASLCD